MNKKINSAQYLTEFVKNSGFFITLLFIYEIIFQPVNLFEISHFVILFCSIFQAFILVRYNFRGYKLYLANLLAPFAYLIFEFLFDRGDFLLGYHFIYFAVSLSVAILIVFEKEFNKDNLKINIIFSITRNIIRVSAIPALSAIGVSNKLFLDDNWQAFSSVILQRESLYITVTLFFLATLLGIESGIVDYLLEESNAVKEKIKNLSFKMIGRGIVEDAMDKGFHDLKKTERSVLFMDIRGYTAFSDAYDQKTLGDVMNQYYDLASNIVHAHNLEQIKFAGDEVMAVFKNPADCLASALTLAKEINDFLDGYKLSVGIGINSGICLEGFVGSSEVKKYDVFGDMINVCKRIEGKAGQYEITTTKEGTEIFKDKRITWELDSYDHELKGKTKPIQIYRSQIK
ncbi:hypothetical protein COY25_00865 [Candidatus Uhrbacteria bacterium CG_4_10_14_0_2_um_filter_41_7]|uniref:Guanylate cyclase domain-containing protein n=1 Tax=Candidatus Uhrbacteria bacterium CG_4_9_14_3_um_filter_41_35 TaxID=1975034 RepID=A0A2M7XF13_9BACT|nr:MAG: hypothetical protein COV92_03215 [Candidatus Uhrbacteria bacterium CG11_big_fil_rev_8_21_14_0_20_41_9]PIZ55531.1 MAG: hypothetical protein COY25_00865 [Candidatus Uhrbacteria bacterium CG_4_10_14_0_2_um_filter_41_7]PJA46460.1 MAG: hypothetical protein CO173_01700 [Candidatus Uhrbacteria bacterium CG_4_9_14_3_um_filter_41_35]